jgi:hypothetical protein
MINGTHPLGEGGDSGVVCDVDDLNGDAWIVVGAGQLVLVAAGDDDARTL